MTSHGATRPALVADLIRGIRSELPLRSRPRLDVGSTKGVRAHEATTLPLYVVPVFDLRESSLDRLFRQLYGAQVASDGFRVVLFTSGDLFRRARAYGWAVEHVMDEASWIGRRRTSAEWESYAVASFRWAVGEYGAQGILVPDANGDLTGELLLARLPVSEEHLNGADGPGEPYSSWREWSDGGGALRWGTSQVKTHDQITEVQAVRGDAHSHVVFLGACDGDADSSLLAAARHSDWSTVVLSATEDEAASELGARMCLSLTPPGYVRVAVVGSSVVDVDYLVELNDFIVRADGDQYFVAPCLERDADHEARLGDWQPIEAGAFVDAVDDYVRWCRSSQNSRLSFAAV
ncbi:hypothetical protein ACFQ80_14085 [Isoptericola sp. NPDC056578]|uniref:hypothetical protein n=1 Tax=Isoptericola sp. NPDC056578 TaxID=3345870 RepID=UPI003688CE94